MGPPAAGLQTIRGLRCLYAQVIRHEQDDVWLLEWERSSAPQADKLLPFVQLRPVASDHDLQLLPRSQYEHRNAVRADAREALVFQLAVSERRRF